MKDDISFSRVHMTIFFDEWIQKWRVRDGDNLKKPSSNGTW